MLSKLYSFFGRRPPRRTLIRDLRMGEFQCIEGEAIAIGEPLIAPFSGTECASLSVLNQYPLTVSRRGTTRWSPEKHFVFRHHFYVRDESGLVRVERCKRTKVFAYKFPTKKVPAETRVASLAAFRGSVHEDEDVLALFNARIRATPFRNARWHEVVIAQGSRVRIEGHIRASGQPLPVDAVVGFRDAPAMLELASARKNALRITRIKSTEEG